MTSQKAFIGSAFLLMFLGASNSFAQNRVALNMIAGDYSMGDMKAFQEEFKENITLADLPFEIVSDFSWSLQGEFNYQIAIGNAFVGPFLNYTVTEGRIHYGDYSGENIFEQNFQRFSFGAVYSENVAKSIELYAKAGLSIAQLDLYGETSINGLESVSESVKFISSGGNLELGINKYFRISPSFNIITGAGMEFNLIKGKLNAKDIDNAFLINEDGNEVKPDFTGIRLRLGIQYSFSSTKTSDKLDEQSKF